MFERLIGYGPYVWGAYALFGLALMVELWVLRAGRRATLRRVAEVRLLAELATRERGQRHSSGDEA